MNLGARHASERHVARYVTVERETALLLPPDLGDWVPSNHLVHLIIDAVGELDFVGQGTILTLTADHATREATPWRITSRSRAEN